MNVEAFINLQSSVSSHNFTFRTAKLRIYFDYAMYLNDLCEKILSPVINRGSKNGFLIEWSRSNSRQLIFIDINFLFLNTEI